jgi:segregation and condensation protein A
MIVLFLAILELVKMQAIVLAQTDLFGDIGLKRNPSFDEAVAAETSLTAIEQEYS